ncbi:microfibril-associated glycoprotein 4-like isoform X2 [Macrobrachium nipponense]|uniref:Ficolin 2 n=1 Tax=Macrobrachium nipponense TaxID=159736 RepID=A0A223FQV6_MACNP|nr:ficolin 2 [Macrobrachium nipponense]
MMDEARTRTVTIFLLFLLNIVIGGSSPTLSPVTENQCALYTLPLELVEGLLSFSNATSTRLESLIQAVNQRRSGDDVLSDSPSLDIFSKLLVLLLEKIEKEQDRFREEVATVSESLKWKSPMEDAVLATLNQMHQDIKGLQAQSKLSSPEHSVNSSRQTCLRSPDRPKDCYELYLRGEKENGVYTIYPDKCRQDRGIPVWCDQEGDGGGWTVVLSRRPLAQQVEFNRGWRDYKMGFGDPQTEHWIGNEVLHLLTSNARQTLRIDMEDWDNATRYVEYETFTVGSEKTNYRLYVDGFGGDGGDSLSYHNNMAFSTTDRDNDLNDSNCAQAYAGGFWYNSCHRVSATSPLLTKQISTKGINWSSWYSDRTTLKEMYFKVKELPCN